MGAQSLTVYFTLFSNRFVALLPTTLPSYSVLVSESDDYSQSVAIPPYFSDTLPQLPVVSYYEIGMEPGAAPMQFVRFYVDHYIPDFFVGVTFVDQSDLLDLYNAVVPFFGQATEPDTTPPVEAPTSAPAMVPAGDDTGPPTAMPVEAPTAMVPAGDDTGPPTAMPATAMPSLSPVTDSPSAAIPSLSPATDSPSVGSLAFSAKNTSTFVGALVAVLAIVALV